MADNMNIRRRAGIGSQLILIILLFFFSVVLVNIVDFNSIKQSETTMINRLGEWSLLIFIFITAILYAGAFPSAILGAASGAVLGILNGVFIYIPAAFIASIVIYYISRIFLQNKLHKLVKKNKLLTNLEKIADKEGLHFLLILRYLPVHPTFISAFFGIVKIKPGRFLISLLFLLPELILQVYIGYVAVSMPGLLSEQSWGFADFMKIFSLVIAIASVIYLGWIARKTIQKTKVQE